MIYNPSNPLDVERAKLRLSNLISKGKPFELKELRAKRSLSQNAYLHLLFAHYAIETGNTIEWVKQKYFKELVNPDIFVLVVHDKYLGETKTIRSSADLDSGELTKCIDKFIFWCENECGILMPRPIDIDFLNIIEYEYQRNRTYL